MYRYTPEWFHSDNAGVAMTGIAYIAHAGTYFGLLVPPTDWPAHVLEELASRPVWGAIWALTGVFCLIASFWSRLLPAAVGLAVSLGGLWGLSWAAEAVFEHQSRHASSAVGWLLVTALIVWAMSRGRVGEVRLAERVRAGELK